MAIEVTPLGFQKPDGAEPIRDGDNIIAANAQKSEDRHQEERGRLDLIEQKNADQDAALADLPNQYVPLTRGTLPDGTDLNTLTGPAHVGTYSLLGNSTYPNAPAGLTGAATLVVQRGGGSSNFLSVSHQITEGAKLFWREANDAAAGNWPAWSQAETTDHAAATYEPQTAAAQKLTDAKAYTDSKDSANRNDWASADTTNLTSAKAYTAAEVLKDRNRLTSIEAKQAVKSVRLESGKWVWDLAGATHYLFPEAGGGLAVHATPWPVPNPTTPALDW